MAEGEGSSRFASVSKADIATLLCDKDSEKHQKGDKSICRSSCAVLARKGRSTDFISLSTSALNELLKKFYVEARRKNKEPYRKSSLTAIRFGFCRHIKDSRPDVDIRLTNGQEFEEANRVFKAKTVELKRKGKGES